MRILAFLFIYWLFGSSIFAQTINLTLQVQDKTTLHPVVGATAYISALERGTAADLNGRAVFNGLPNGSHLIEIQSLGYQKLEKSINLYADTLITVYLEPQTYNLDELTIEAAQVKLTEVATNISILTKERIHQHRGQTLGESISQLAGVEMISMGPSISKPVIRGLHSQRIKILNAGVAQEGQQWGGEHAPEIDPFAPEDIQVIRGAAGLEYGLGAIGGVIKIEPRSWAFGKRVGGEFQSNFFQNNYQGAASLQLEGGFTKKADWAWMGRLSMRVAGDAQTPDYRITNSGFRERNFAIGTARRSDKLKTEVYYSRFFTELGVYKGSHIGNTSDLQRAIERGEPLVYTSFTYDIAPPKQRIGHHLISVNNQLRLNSGDMLEVQYGWQQNSRQEFDGHRRFSDVNNLDPAFELTLTTYQADIKLRQKPRNGWFGTVGFSGNRQGNVRQGAYLIPGYRAYSGSVFAIQNLDRGRWLLQGGLRYDYQWMRIYPVESRNIELTDLNFDNISAAFNALYRWNSEWSTALNISQSWRPPAINELFSNGVHHGTAQYEIGNANLSNEISQTVETTLKYQSGKGLLSAAIYYSNMSGFIYSRPRGEPILTIRGAFPSFEYAQDDVRMGGGEFNGEFELVPRLVVGVQGSVVRAYNLDRSEFLIFMPSDRYSAILHFDLGDLRSLSDGFFEIRMQHVLEQTRFPEGVDYLEPPAAYSLLNLQLGYNVQLGALNVRANLSVNNALNERYRDYLSRYRYFINETGRDIILRLEIPF